MADLQEVLRALKQADAAGNTEDAQRLATLARQMQAETPITEEAAPPQGGTIADPLGQGLTFGFADEIAGALGATVGTFDDTFEGTTFGERYRGIRDAARENQAAFSERNPGTALAAEIAGGVATGGVGAARTGAFQAAKNAPTLLGRLRPVIQTGATQGAAFGAGKSEAEDLRGVAADTARGAGIGAATAPVLPLLAGGTRSAAQRIFQTQGDNPAFQRAVDLLKKKAGITNLTTGQRTGSGAIRSTETTAAETVFGGRIARQVAENRNKLQSAIMRLSGFPGTNDDVARGIISREAIDAAQNAFSKKYNGLLQGRTVRLDTNDFVDAISDVQAKHGRLLPFQQKKQINEIVEQLFDDVTTGPTSATRYNKIRSDLARLERNTKANNSTFSDFYRDLKHAIDDEVAGQLGFGTTKKALDTQYSRFTTVRDTFDGLGGIDAARGQLPLSSLLRNAQSARRGTDREFQDLVRAGQAVLGDPAPNSATASRIANLAFLGEGSASATGLIDPTAGLATLGLPMLGTQGLARGFTGNTVANRLIDAGLLTVPATQPGLINPQ